MRSRRSKGLATAALILCACAPGALAPPSEAAVKTKARPRPPAAARPAPNSVSALHESRFRVDRKVLGNGLVVLLHEDHSVPSVTFWQWFRVGSRNERPGITGISHVFEHMMFNGSKNVPPKEYDRRIEANGGASNAFTDRDVTAYYEDIASDRLEVVLQLDADRMRGLTLDPKVLQSELEVVKEERRLRTDDDIAGMLDEKLYETAFRASPYRWPVLGWRADLERLKREDLVEYFKIHYAPNNCILVLTGDFDTAAALALIEKHFGDLPAHPRPAALPDSEPPQDEERRATVEYPSENVHVDVGYKAPGIPSEEVWVLDVLSSILADGESSRLHQSLVYEKQIAISASTFFRPRLQPSLFEVYVELKPGRGADEAIQALDETIARLAREGPTDRELRKAQNLLEAQFVGSLKTNNGVGEQLGFYEHVFGDYRTWFRAVPRYRAVTAADCKRVAAQVFAPERRTVVTLVPKGVGTGAPGGAR